MIPEDNWVSQGGKQEMLKSHTLGTDKPCMSLWILHFLVMCLCSETSTFLTFNHWTKSSTKVLVEKWNEAKYLESTFKETKGKNRMVVSGLPPCLGIAWKIQVGLTEKLTDSKG